MGIHSYLPKRNVAIGENPTSCRNFCSIQTEVDFPLFPVIYPLEHLSLQRGSQSQNVQPWHSVIRPFSGDFAVPIHWVISNAINQDLGRGDYHASPYNPGPWLSNGMGYHIFIKLTLLACLLLRLPTILAVHIL